MATLHLTLLGGFNADVDGHGLDALPTRKARALLAILATSPDHRQPRERLAAMLWERSAEEQARASLRQTLASVRKVLAEAGAGDTLEADADAVWLDGKRCDVDALKFATLLEEDHLDALDRACRLYSGDFLAGLSLREESFEEWLINERRRFQELARRALTRLLDQFMQDGEHVRAMDVAARLLAIDPLQETVHRALMKIHAREGRRGLALRQFASCRELLKRELDVEADAATMALAESIRKQEQSSSAELEAPQSSADADLSTSDTTMQDEEASARTAREQPAAFPGEIRPVTVLFARFSVADDNDDPPDPEQHHRLAQTFQDATEAAVERYGGHVDNRIGDTVVAVFGIPFAHGNDAERALRAAVDIRTMTPELSDGAEHSLAARVGVAGGQVVVSAGEAGQRAYAMTGDSVDIARQLELMSDPGEILATQSVLADAARFFDSQAVPNSNLRSRGRRLSVQRVGSLRDSPRWVRTTRFVGRQLEMDQMRSVLDACRDRGHAHMVFVRGEPGIGKTRLLEETAELAKDRGFGCYRALIFDFGTSKNEEVPRALARALLGLSSSADEPERERAADDAMTEERTTDERRVFLNDLLDLPQPLELRSRFDAMDERIRHQGMTDVLSDLVRSRCARHPVLMMIEDLHWAEAPIVESLALLVSSLAAQKFVLLMTSRIEGDPLDQNWRTATREVPLVTIDLRLLHEEDAASLADDISDKSEDFRRRCVERAQGNPLFLEQLLRATAEDDAGDAIPSSVQELALSRSDRLEASDRDALRAASVLGQRFDIDALRELLKDPDYECTELVAHDLARPDRGDYLFAHALIRDGIYASLLTDARHALHLRAADWFAHRDLALRANHLDAADDPKAPGAYAQAAQEAFRAYRVERALQLVGHGLRIAAESDRCLLLNLKGEFHYHVGPVAESLASYRAALDSTQNEVERCRVLVGMAMCLRMVDDYEGAMSALDEAEPIAEAHDAWEDLARLYITRGNLAFWKGQTDNCLPYQQRALDYARKAGSVELEVHALGGIGDAYYAGGRMRSAHKYFLQCVEAAKKNGLGRVQVAYGQMIGGGTMQYFLDLRASLSLCHETAKFAADVGSLRNELQVNISAANAAISLGELEAARNHIEIAKQLTERLGAKRTKARYLCYLGRVLIAEGKREQACKVLEEAIAESLESGPGYCGAAVLGSLARATDSAERRRSALSEGETLLAEGSVGHNFLEFYDEAIEACLETKDWEGVARYTALLEGYVAAEPLPFTDFIIARGRALAAFGKGERDKPLLDELRALAQTAKQHELALAIPALDQALSLPAN